MLFLSQFYSLNCVTLRKGFASLGLSFPLKQTVKCFSQAIEGKTERMGIRREGLATEPVPGVNIHTATAGSCWVYPGPGRSHGSPIRAGWSHVGHLGIKGNWAKPWPSNVEKPRDRYPQAKASSSRVARLASGHHPVANGKICYRSKIKTMLYSLGHRVSAVPEAGRVKLPITQI